MTKRPTLYVMNVKPVCVCGAATTEKQKSQFVRQMLKSSGSCLKNINRNLTPGH